MSRETPAWVCFGVMLVGMGIQSLCYCNKLETQQSDSKATTEALEFRNRVLVDRLVTARQQDFERRNFVSTMPDDCKSFEGKRACEGRQVRDDLLEHRVPFLCDEYGCAWSDCGAPR